jgi:hypothetical protein
MEAELEYHQEDQLWVGRYIPGTARDIPIRMADASSA